MKKMFVIFGLIVLAMFVVSCAPTGEAFYRPKKTGDLIPKAPSVPKAFGQETVTVCGNDVIEGMEICDNGNGSIKAGKFFSGVTCQSYGFVSGKLHCSSDCKTISPTFCNLCGDFKIDSDEVCDGTTFKQTTLAQIGTFENTWFGPAKIIGLTCNECSVMKSHEISCAANQPIVRCVKYSGGMEYYKLRAKGGSILKCPSSGKYISPMDQFGNEEWDNVDKVNGCPLNLKCKDLNGKLITANYGYEGICK